MTPALTLAQKFWIFLLFLIAGPPLGALLFAPLFIFGGNAGFVDPGSLIALFAALSIFSYLFGLLPAGLAGVLFLLVAPHLHIAPTRLARYREFMGGALCGLLAAAVFFFLFSSLTNTSGKSDFKLLVFFSLVPGFIGGGICGQFAKRLLNNPSACPQLTRETVGLWVVTIVGVAVFFSALLLVRN